MSNTKPIPTDKFGNIYYGPRTLKEARDILNNTSITLKEMVDLLTDHGFSGIAARIRKQYL